MENSKPDDITKEIDITCGNCWEIYYETVTIASPKDITTSCPHCYENNVITNPLFIGEGE